MNPKIQSLTKMIQTLSPSRRPYEVFRDFIELAAIRISARVDPVHFKNRHETALLTQQKYSDTEKRLRYA